MAFLGIDIGSTITRAALIDEDLHMIALTNTPTHIDGTFETAVGDVRTATSKALGQTGYRIGAIEGVCISVSGIVDDESGRAFSPALGWIDPMPVRVIARKYTSAPVFVANDAQAAAVGEAYYGAGMPFDRFALIRFGTLIEVAMAIDAVSVENDELPAQVATEGEFLLEARELAGEYDGSGIDLSGIGLGRIRSSQIMEEARRQNPIAKRAVDWLAGRMAESVVEACAHLKPQAIVLSGAAQCDQQHLGTLLARKLTETRSPIAGIPVVNDVLGNDAKAFGAALIALRRA